MRCLGHVRCADPPIGARKVRRSAGDSVPVCGNSTWRRGVERVWRGRREGREGQVGAEERRVGAPFGAGYVPIGALYLPPYSGRGELGAAVL